MPNWSYEVLETETDVTEIDDACTTAGGAGWELVSAIVLEAAPGEWSTRLIFKKPSGEQVPLVGL